MSDAYTDNPGPDGPHPAARRRLRGPLAATLALVLAGWLIAAVNTGVSYAALGMEFIPIMVGVVLCFGFAIALHFLHQAWWLAVLSAGPALLVLVGSVQYAPEAALDRRGIRETVLISDDSARGTSSKQHRYTLVAEDGRTLDETLDHRGSNPPYRLGDRIDVLRDPDGVVPVENADKVDPGSQLDSLLLGSTGWTLIALLAGRRGHLRRRRALHAPHPRT